MSATDDVIVTRGLGKRFGDRIAVDHLDLVVRRADVFGFLGPNGAGKSTTIRMLLGLIAPTAGEAFVAGHSIRRARTRALRHVGAIIEAPSFYDQFSGRKNLELALILHGRRDPTRIDEVLGLVGLSGRADDPVAAWSHGMR